MIRNVRGSRIKGKNMEIIPEVNELLINKGFKVVEDKETAYCLNRNDEYLRALKSEHGCIVYTYMKGIDIALHGTSIEVSGNEMRFHDNGSYVGYVLMR